MMKTIQIVIDSKLLRAADEAARRCKVNRSALIRDALRRHLQRLETQELEARDCAGYGRGPQNEEEISSWESEAAWPE